MSIPKTIAGIPSRISSQLGTRRRINWAGSIREPVVRLALRVGLAEAGYVPGILLYLTYWFRRKEQARAIALFLMGSPIASLLGSPLSGFLLDQVDWFGTWISRILIYPEQAEFEGAELWC